MSPINIIRTALNALGSNKLRSSLTLLGIVIGITAVTVLMSIGASVQSSISAQIQSQGTNLLFVRPGPSISNPFPSRNNTQSASWSYSALPPENLTISDAEALIDPALAPSIKAVAPEIRSGATLVAGRASQSASVLGITPDYAIVRDARVAHGQFITQAHIRNRAEVAVLSADVADALFYAQDPIGKTVRVNGRQFRVVGVLEDSGASTFGFSNEMIYVPISTAYYRMSSERTLQGDVPVGTINVEAISAEAIHDAELEIATILRLRHRNTGADDFTIDTLQDLLNTLNQVTAVIALFLGTVGGISLLVGGIGVMNVMLVSVTERTREIGIRKAMGAKQRDILMQFLSEAVFLTLGGGAIGLLFSMMILPVIAFAINQGGAAQSPLGAIAFQGGVALLALSVAIAVGLLSGIYPALRAARMHPIDALRHE